MADDRPLHWKVEVRDARERQRRARIGVRDGRVVLVPPPGEGFTMRPQDADYMAASLQAAATQARAEP